MYVETCRHWSFEGYCVNNTKGLITISNSNVDANKDGGIFIVSRGPVTLNSVSAEQNEVGGLTDGDGAGLIIITAFSTAASPVNLILINSSENNYGIEILAKGTVNLSNVTTNSNNNFGLYIDNSYGNSPVNMTINKNSPTVNNESNSNGGDGIIIYSNAVVTIMNVEACNNGGGGVYIDTTYYGKIAPVVISVVDPVNGLNNFSTNADFGLAVYSYGTVKISSVNANENAAIGAYINNQLATGTKGPSVSISNSTFDMNCQSDEEGDCEYGNEVLGLEVRSFGLVTLLNVSASKNDGSGIIVITNGMISATNIVANENNGDGAYFDNSLGGLIQGVNLFASTGEGNSFLDNVGCGLMIVANGTVTINNITANGNSMGYGLYIDNSKGRGSVTIKQADTWQDSSGNQWLGNVFNSNKNGGVYISSNGNVTVNFFSIKANEGSGIIIITTSSSGAVTLNGLASNYASNISANQGGNGISITAKGNIILNNIQSVDNGAGNGAFLNNSTGNGGITIINGYFNNNKNGLIIESNGAVVWTNGSASDNSGLGASINNMINNSTNKSVKVSNVMAERNRETGLNIQSKGSVNLTNVSADSNSANGYELQMDDLWNDFLNSDQTWTFVAPDSGQVTINLTSEDFSPVIEIYDGEGILIASGSATAEELTIALSDLSTGEIYQIKIMSGESGGGAYYIDISDTTNQPSSFTVKESKAYGIYIDNSQGSSASVTLTNSTQNYENSGTNVYIKSSGAVTVTNLNSTNSGANGLVVINTNSAKPQPVSLTNINTNSNGLSGTIVTTKGTVTIKTGTANSNGDFGLQINNTEGNRSVALTSFTSNNNDETGIVITSKGSVKMVSVTCNQNDGSGIEITTLGAVTFTYVNAVGNHGYGSYVVTQSTFMNISSALGYSQFNQNYEDGLYVEAKGKISIAKVSASNNGYDSEGNYIGNAIGLNIHGTDATGKSPITLTDIRAENNTADGLFIITAGGVTIKTLATNNNRGDGLNIQQTAATTGGFAIALSSINAEFNGRDGINVKAFGKVTVTKFMANNNDGDGVEIVDSGTTGSVMLTAGTVNNQANNNGGTGVLIDSVSTVTIIGLEVNNNSGGGILVDNSESSALATVTLTKVVTNTNEGNGVQVVSKGNTILNTVSALSNDQNGVFISTISSVTMNRSTASTNGWSGFYVDAPSLKLSSCIYTDNVKEPVSGDEKNLLFTGSNLIGA